ncbi:hypothetical protein DSCA_35450 [Desulfosarcina alkanivorans]|uniref:Uncharacterized protein n=1 Tax=Desulfosarcina alkanivorans TaxID=571177 RepID=A0A5K7YML0_9BACT|nr:isochorismatase family protein [Desulfosarcina alkanivorans]BBO69615.1 hypothetical protein DSCA_35450 [Desulfosarcina alkanivorans]
MTRPDNFTRPEYDRSALITIDVQNDTLDGGPFEIPGTSAILPQISGLCRRFRHAGRPIVHVIRIYTPDAGDADRCRRGALLAGKRMLLKGSTGRRPAGPLLPGNDIRIDDELLMSGAIQPIGPREAIVYKPRWGAFYRTPLEAHLRKNGVSTLVFCGCNFPNCPRVSIYEASERNFRITAVADAISNMDQADACGLETIGVTVSTTEAVGRHIQGLQAVNIGHRLADGKREEGLPNGKSWKDGSMNILFAAPENAWGGFLGMVRKQLPNHRFRATGGFAVDSLDGVEVLIPTMSPVTREVLAGADRLKLIQQCGSGLEGVDLAAAAEKDIFVANVPTATSGNADSVAEVGIYLMIGLHRDVRAMDRSMREKKMGQPQGRALGGKTVGIVGLGGIGQALVKRLKGFGVRIIGIKRQAPQAAETALGLDWVGAAEQLPELLAQSDVVFLCVPATPATTGLMNRETLARMKPEAYLINLSRGGLVERDALEWALSSGTIAGAGLDVFWEEPPDPDDPIFRQNVLATPHIGGSTDLSMQGIVAGVVENIRRLEAGRTPLNCAKPQQSNSRRFL